MRVNVGQKALEATDRSGRRTAIRSSTVVVVKERERLILLGEDNGRAWSAVIGQRSGEMSASSLDPDGGFLMSGACTLP